MKNQIYLGFSEYLLRPELFLASRLHLALTLWTGMFIPQSDVITAALQTQTANLTSIGRCHVGNDATYHDVLDGLAVRTRHGRNLLTKEPTSFVHLGLVAALSAAIFQFPSHTPFFYRKESVRSLISICGLMRSYNILYTASRMGMLTWQWRLISFIHLVPK